MLKILAELPSTDPQFYKELSQSPRGKAPNPRAKRGSSSKEAQAEIESESEYEEEGPFSPDRNDDASVPVDDIIDHITSGGAISPTSRFMVHEGALVESETLAESLDAFDDDFEEADTSEDESAGYDSENDEEEEEEGEPEEEDDDILKSVHEASRVGRGGRIRKPVDLNKRNQPWFN